MTSIWRRLLMPVATVAMLLTAAPSADAQRRWGEFRAEQWQQLDAKRVQPGTRNTVMQVGRLDGRHTAVRLQVLDDAIFIQSLVVTYGNGTQTEIPVRRLMRPGETTPPLDLEGDARFIRDVNVTFRQDPDWRRTARLVLLGDRVEARGPTGPSGPTGRPGGIGVLNDRLPQGWMLFGTTRVSSGRDRDSLYVGRERGRFDKIALRVQGSDVFVRDIVVRYGDGQVQEFRVDSLVRADYRTAELKLERPSHIETIDFVYGTSYRGRPASVEVWGEQAQRWLRGEDRDPGWFLIGAQSASMFRRDNDAFQVGDRYGRIARIQLTARNGDVSIRAVTFNYANGESETLPVGRMLRRGQSSPEFTLRGRQGFGGRNIVSIVMNYQSQLSLTGNATVEIWAHQ